MIVHVRNKDIHINDGSSVLDWMNECDLPNREIALIQVNDKEIRREEYEKYILHDGDKIQVLYFLGDS